MFSFVLQIYLFYTIEYIMGLVIVTCYALENFFLTALKFHLHPYESICIYIHPRRDNLESSHSVAYYLFVLFFFFREEE